MIDRWNGLFHIDLILFYFMPVGSLQRRDPTQLIVLLVTNHVIPRNSHNPKSIVYVNQTVNHSASS